MNIRDQTNRQVVTYNRLKTMENHQTVSPNSGCCRLQEVLVHERFQLEGFDWESFGVLDSPSIMGGGHLREVVAHGGST